MNIRVREMQRLDAAAVTRLTNQLGYAIPEELTGEYINDILAQPGMCVLVVTENEMIRGWIQVFQTIRLESGRFCEIGGLIVEESARGNGCGRLLIKAAAAWTRKAGFNKLKVRCNIVRQQAHDFYESNGFIAEKQQKVFCLSL